MSADRFDRVTAIASRQPALNPARHVSPAVLEYQLQQVETERDDLANALLYLLDEPSHNSRSFARALLARINAQPLAPVSPHLPCHPE